jgi:Tat protein secretion system quality control protein TatD with DNase activity
MLVDSHRHLDRIDFTPFGGQLAKALEVAASKGVGHFLGKPNQPAWLRHVAEYIAELRDEPFEQLAENTTANYFRLFRG